MKAYSYVRFSSSQQAKGTSLEREAKAATEYVQRRGWELDNVYPHRHLIRILMK